MASPVTDSVRKNSAYMGREARVMKLLAIIGESGLFLAAGNHACAEATLYDADSYVVNNASAFQGNSVDPNSYGWTRARLFNLFYFLWTVTDGNYNPITNLPINIGFPLLDPGPNPTTCTKPHL